MCGISGCVGTQTDDSVLQAMVRSLQHRGPDGKGHWTNQEAALGHNRLAIIDLTDAASQPMSTPDDRYRIVFNGEIYNYRELRIDLQQAGETFQSASDTEVLLVGYRKWGKQVLDKVRGMFAFAVWDDYRKQLFLARDRVGIKPLFYALLEKGLVFASEIKAILVRILFSKTYMLSRPAAGFNTKEIHSRFTNIGLLICPSQLSKRMKQILSKN
jgi:asparagine synthase (glutamine-hydrolysing)